MIEIECVLGDNPVYLEDWTADLELKLRGGVCVRIDAEVEAAVDFTPDQARGFARELIAAADRASMASQR